jgi:hypothetical protein
MDSLWKSYADLITLPVRAVLTGRVQGMEVSRSPLHWLPLWIAALVIPPVMLVLFPLYVALTFLGGGLTLYAGSDARITEEGIEVFSKRKGILARHAWQDVRSVSLRSEPPVLYPELLLASGQAIPLQLADFEALASACAKHGIPAHRNERIVSPD